MMPNVTVENRLSQTITVSTDAGGGPEELKLSPNEESDALDSSYLTDFTEELARKSYLTVRLA